MTTLSEITLRREELLQERKAVHQDFRAKDKALESRLKALCTDEAVLCAGFDVERIKRARDLVTIRGRVSDVRHGAYPDQRRDSVRPSALNDAVVEIAKGGGRLLSEFIGVKNYDHFGDQRSDHQYGYGPRHGNIVFSIGLRHPDKTPLTPDQIEDALYFLKMLPGIESAEAKAA